MYRNAEEITKDEFRFACSKSKSIAELVMNLNLRPHKDISSKLKELSYKFMVPLPVWNTRSQPQDKKIGKLSVDDRLSYGRYIKGSSLRAAMISKGVDYVCSNATCPLHVVVEWCGAPITLQVDHINGDNIDNRLENLRFLCPNCHTQTETFSSKRNWIDCECGRRRREGIECPHRLNGQEDKVNLCFCGAKKSYRAKRCKPCSIALRRKTKE